jgi:hypothetical protein
MRHFLSAQLTEFRQQRGGLLACPTSGNVERNKME